ncbi:MAG: TIM barrel protein [Gemmatimonadetes bacterium]|nr:TIM barrel protein [Gemmatimonadota bacterium]
MNRRQALGALGAFGVTATAGKPFTVHGGEREVGGAARSNAAGVSLKQSVSRWCYGSLTLDQLSAAAKEIGLVAIDLLDRNEWEVPKKYGLACAMANGFGTIPKGFNRPDQHDKLVADAEEMIPAAAAAGVPNIVCFSGNRQGLSDGEGIANCVTGLKRLAPVAERHGVTLCLELLNSKVDHKDYQCDHTAWGAEVVKGVGSPRVKLLYDIYHMQIMEGDVVRTIRTYAPHIAHFHTGGVPGRNEIDDTQELNYRRIAQAVVETGFTGYLAHEFVPKRDPLTSLRDAVRICAV